MSVADITYNPTWRRLKMSLTQDFKTFTTGVENISGNEVMSNSILPHDSLEQSFTHLADNYALKVIENNDERVEACFEKQYGTLYITFIKATHNLLVWSVGSKGYRKYIFSKDANKDELLKGFMQINELK
jgi:hypothetical protein